ncbi:hypothetical protein Tco_1258378 [Tanacetum coccineum]
MEDDVDINALTIEQYMDLIPGDIKPAIVNPKIGDDVEFKINANFMRELRRKLFAGIDDEGQHLTKEYPLKKEDEAIKPSRYMESLEGTIIKFCEDTIKKQIVDDERMRNILENTKSIIRALNTRTKNLQEKAYQLTHKVLTNTREKVKAITTMGKENMKEPVPRNLSSTPFLGHLKEQMDNPYRTHETVRIIANPEEIHNVDAHEEEGDMDVGWDITNKDVERMRQFPTPTLHTLPNLKLVVQSYMPLGPVHDKDKIVREKEQDCDIPLNDNVMQPLTP